MYLAIFCVCTYLIAEMHNLYIQRVPKYIQYTLKRYNYFFLIINCNTISIRPYWTVKFNCKMFALHRCLLFTGYNEKPDKFSS